MNKRDNPRRCRECHAASPLLELSCLPHVVSANDYAPFGMRLNRRTFSTNAYRYYGFNGKEQDIEIASEDYDYGARIYDSRIGRWLSVDPLQQMYASISPYAFSFNNPIIYCCFRQVNNTNQGM